MEGGLSDFKVEEFEKGLAAYLRIGRQCIEVRAITAGSVKVDTVIELDVEGAFRIREVAPGMEIGGARVIGVVVEAPAATGVEPAAAGTPVDVGTVKQLVQSSIDDYMKHVRVGTGANQAAGGGDQQSVRTDNCARSELSDVLSQTVTAAIGSIAPAVAGALQEAKSTFPMEVEDLEVAGAERPFVYKVIRFGLNNASNFSQHSDAILSVVQSVVSMIPADGRSTAAVYADTVAEMAAQMVLPKHDMAWAAHLRKGLTEVTRRQYIPDVHGVRVSGIRLWVSLLNVSLDQSAMSMKKRAKDFRAPGVAATRSKLLEMLGELEREYDALSKPAMGKQALDHDDGYEALEYVLSNWKTVKEPIAAMWHSSPDLQGDERLLQCVRRSRRLVEAMDATVKPDQYSEWLNATTVAGKHMLQVKTKEEVDKLKGVKKTADRPAAAPANRANNGQVAGEPRVKDPCKFDTYRGYTCRNPKCPFPHTATNTKDPSPEFIERYPNLPLPNRGGDGNPKAHVVMAGKGDDIEKAMRDMLAASKAMEEESRRTRH